MGFIERSIPAAIAALALCACATLQPPADSDQKPATAAASDKNAAPAAGGTPARPDPAAPKPFADVIKDARQSKGYFTLWQKDEKVWFEVAPDQLDKPFFFGGSLASGLGERFFLPGLMGREHVAVLRRAGNQLQLIAQNLLVRAPADTPLAAAVRESYSDSLLASAPIVSAPHPERQSFLVDAHVLFSGDVPGAQTALETAYRLAYSIDAKNTSIEKVKTAEQGTSITVRAHYAVAKLPAPPLTPPAPGTPRPQPPRTLPDNRSLFLTFTYNLAPLPAQPMRPRKADERIGHFTTAFWDFGDELGRDARTHYVERWRLEKKDPQAAVSEPKEPVTVWMDKNIPDKYRGAVRAGIVEWNKAFERAGFKNALVVKQQPADADWSTVEGTRHIAVRWFAMQGPGAAAVGPSQSDPRTGELLRGAAIIPENWVRFSRTLVGETLPKPPALPAAWSPTHDGEFCTYAFEALEHAAFGFDLLVARGALDPKGPDADRFVFDSLKEVTMHEVGHALGLRHNFKASTGIALDKLADTEFVRERGLSNSVMDYIALNIPLENEAPREYHQVTLGAYDYWAIEYAYREFPPQTEAAELAKLAARADGDPNLVYATDEDAMGAIDPLVNTFDLGNDPLAYYKRRFALTRELWQRTEKRELSAGESYSLYRRNLIRGFTQLGAVAPLIAKYVGGVYTARVEGGSERPLLTPVPAPKQREALDLLTRELFSAASFRFDPHFMSRLGIDHLERFSGFDIVQANPDFSLASTVLGVQQRVLDQLMSDGVAQRLADAESKVADRKKLLSFADVQGRLTDAIWSELANGGDIDSLRRNLQREHLRRLAGALVRASSNAAADVRAVQRLVAVKLQADLRTALAKNHNLSAVARAHLSESLATLTEALKAPLMKQGV
jgi:hypothetical protein